MTASDSSSVKPPRWKSAELSLMDEDLVGADRRADGSGDLEQEPAAALRVSAPLVVAAVGVRREKLIDEVPVCGVDLHAVEAGVDDDARGPREAVDQLDDLVCGQGARLGERRPHVDLDRAGRDGQFGEPGEGLAAGVIELHQRRGAVALGGCRPPPQLLDVAVVFDDDVEGLADRATVDHHVAGDDEAHAALGPAAVDARELGRRLVGGAAELLTHRGLDQAVLDLGAAGERQRQGQRRRGGDGCIDGGAHGVLFVIGGVVVSSSAAEPS